jgi:hypothetical protein
VATPPWPWSVGMAIATATHARSRGVSNGHAVASTRDAEKEHLLWCPRRTIGACSRHCWSADRSLPRSNESAQAASRARRDDGASPHGPERTTRSQRGRSGRLGGVAERSSPGGRGCPAEHRGALAAGPEIRRPGAPSAGSAHATPSLFSREELFQGSWSKEHLRRTNESAQAGREERPGRPSLSDRRAMPPCERKSALSRRGNTSALSRARTSTRRAERHVSLRRATAPAWPESEKRRPDFSDPWLLPGTTEESFRTPCSGESVRVTPT